MKTISNIFVIIVFVFLSTFISVSKDDICFKLYVCDFETVKDSAKINEFIKLNEPLITDNDIISYNTVTNYNTDTKLITLTDEGWDRLIQVIKNFKGNTNETGIPFIISLNNNFHFDGVFWFMQSSFLPPKKPQINISGFFDSKQRTLNIPFEEILSKSLSLTNQERLFIDCLKAQGKVVE